MQLPGPASGRPQNDPGGNSGAHGEPAPPAQFSSGSACRTPSSRATRASMELPPAAGPKASEVPPSGVDLSPGQLWSVASLPAARRRPATLTTTTDSTETEPTARSVNSATSRNTRTTRRGRGSEARGGCGLRRIRYRADRGPFPSGTRSPVGCAGHARDALVLRHLALGHRPAVLRPRSALPPRSAKKTSVGSQGPRIVGAAAAPSVRRNRHTRETPRPPAHKPRLSLF